MKEKNLLWRTGRIILGALAVYLSLLFTDNTVYAARYVDMNPNDTTWDAYIDEENYICIETYDLKRSSTITYETLGFTLSRCAPGQKALHNGVDSQYIGISVNLDDCVPMNEEVILSDNKVYYYCKFRMPLTDLIDMMISKGYTDWAGEVYGCYVENNDSSVWLKFDGIMTTVVNGKPEGRIFSDGSLKGGKVYYNRPFDQNKMITALENAYGWRDKSKIKTHFNRYLGRGASSTRTDTPIDVTVPAPKSLYETRNYSSVYDISVAIPSGEEVINEISASAMIGNDLDVREKDAKKNFSLVLYARMHYTTPRWVEGSTRTWTEYSKPNYTDTDRIKYTIQKKVKEMLVDKKPVFDNRGNIIDYEPVVERIVYYIITEIKSGYYEYDDHYEYYSMSGQASAKVNYQYIASRPMLLEYESMEVYNNHFPEDASGERKLTYDEKSAILPEVSSEFNIYCKAAQNMGRSYLNLNQHMNVDPSTYDYTPLGNGSHYAFCQSNSFTKNLYIEGTRAGDWSALGGAVQNALNEVADTISSNTWSRNDFAKVETYKKSTGADSMAILMSDTKVTGADVEGSVHYNKSGAVGSATVDTNGVSAARSKYQYGGNGVTINTYVNEFKSLRVVGQKTVTIPISADNVDYPTGVKVTYKDLLFPNNPSRVNMAAGRNFFVGVDSIYDHVMTGGVLPKHNGGDPADGYPIRVHPPVIAPIRIVDKNENNAKEQTQLVEDKYNAGADNQLLLDSNYYVKWDNDTWLSATWGITPEGYENVFDKYVNAKYLRFPFDVVYNGTIYRMDKTGAQGHQGYTDWIEVLRPDDYTISWNEGADPNNYESTNHWQMTPFYIPSFATEAGTPGHDAYVEAKVEARNVNGRDLGNHKDSVQISQNSQTGNYAAQTRKQVQTSGWIYDFTIVGTENGLIYDGEGLLESDMDRGYDPRALCEKNMEIKANAYNRFGNNIIRHLSDGSLTSNISSLGNLPIKDGSSLTFSEMGAVWRGQDFAFTLKTIANLDGPNDSIEIVPSFTYITPDGEVLSTGKGEIKLYNPLTDGKQTWMNEFDPNNWSMESETDYVNKVQLNDELFDQSYYDREDSNVFQYGNWVKASVENENDDLGLVDWHKTDEQEYMNRYTPSYTLNHIHIPASLRYISGEYEQLQMNENRQYNRNTYVSNLLDYKSLNGYNETVEKNFKYSMQQWQSKYVIPSNIRIIDVRTVGGKKFDIKKRIEDTEYWSFSKDPLVFPYDGKLIINFDIIAYKDGEPYLKYSGGGNAKDMWEIEHYIPNPNGPDDPTSPGEPGNPNPPGTPENPINPYDPEDIPIKPGDVVIIDLDRSVGDYWIPSIHNIN